MKLFQRSMSMLLVLVMVLGMVYLHPAETRAAAKDHISTTYASSLSVQTKKTVGLMAEPVSTGTVKYTVPSGTTLTVVALHKNTADTYWYEVRYYNMTLYVDATACAMVSHLVGDVTLSDAMTPAALGYGQGFPLGGTVKSTLNMLGKITASVHYSSNITEQPAISSSDTVDGYSYSLTGSKVDTNMIYSDLPAGSYTHLITAEAISYFINDDGALYRCIDTVVLENKPLIVTNASAPNAVVAKGIDVSVHQGYIDWSKVAGNIDFAILRIGYEYTLDSRFTEFAAACNQYNIPFGVYIYSYAESEAEAIAEAEFVISVLKNYKVDLPVFFDIEDECQSVLGASAIQRIVKAFCETVKDAGYQPGLYTFVSWFNSYFGDSYYNSLPKWVAQIQVNSCSYAKGLTMWQYSWEGSVPGINGNVDCNYYYGELPFATSDKTYLASCTYYPANFLAETTQFDNLRSYPSTDHTVLQPLDAGTQVHVTGVYKNHYGNYWYQINMGDGRVGYIGADAATPTTFLYDDFCVMNPTMDNMALNVGYYLKGKITSLNNNLYQVNARIYAGEDTTATPVLSSSDNPNSKSYTLNYSTVCDNLYFSDLEKGYYTYEISVDVKNYYAEGGVLKCENENVVIWTKGFTVGGAAITPPESVACDHNVVTQPGHSATCTASGKTDGSYCSKCGEVFKTQTDIPALGHKHVATHLPANCVDYAKTQYICGQCGDSYSIYDFEEDAEWTEVKPDVPEHLMETKTQYRYRDKKIITSASAAVAGFTQVSRKWEATDTVEFHYAASWPAGYDKSHTIYSQYNKALVSDSENETTKVTVNFTGKLIGYIYYHWCIGTYQYGPINRATSPTKTDRYSTFHSFPASAETIDPTTYTPASDGSITYPHAGACTDSHWWYYFPVYAQNYTVYKAVYTHEGFTDWSDWSDTAPASADGRQVEERTLYRVAGGELGDHEFVDHVCIHCGETDICLHLNHTTDGICTTCGETAEHSYDGGVCTICGKAQRIPAIKAGAVSLSFEDEIFLNFYFTLADIDDPDAEQMGLVAWNTPRAEGTIENAKHIYPGAITDGINYMVSTDGIMAKCLGDLVYARIYVRLADGSYVYSRMLVTSPERYALNRIQKSTNPEMRQVCVAMLNYGAEAQKFFGHKPYDLANGELTQEMSALISAYDGDMMEKLVPIPGEKSANFRDNGGFSNFYASASFNSAFALNLYFAPARTPDGNLTLYYWSAEDYQKAEVLTTENATEVTVMTPNGREFWGEVDGIAAKQMDQAVYFAVSYEADGVTYTTDVMVYSLGAYCKSLVKQNTDISPLVAATAVYGYYAKRYFRTIEKEEG